VAARQIPWSLNVFSVPFDWLRAFSPTCSWPPSVVLPPTPTTTRLDAIVAGGILRVGLTEDYRPFSFADASGKVEGIDVDMAMSLAQSLGVKLDVVKTSWSTLRSDLETNSFDIAMGGVTITLDRQK
jgi:cyclohexadienyl dehydratase